MRATVFGLGCLVLSLAAGCGARPGGGAREPTLAEQAQPLTLDGPATSEVASACDRTVFAFRPAERGTYVFEARSAVPLSLRLFAMSPDLYLETGTTDAEAAHLSTTLDAGESYAVTLASTECRPTHVEVTVARQ